MSWSMATLVAFKYTILGSYHGLDLSLEGFPTCAFKERPELYTSFYSHPWVIPLIGTDMDICRPAYLAYHFGVMRAGMILQPVKLVTNQYAYNPTANRGNIREPGQDLELRFQHRYRGINQEYTPTYGISTM